MSQLMEWLMKHTQVLAALAELPTAAEEVAPAVSAFVNDKETSAKVMDVFRALAILLAHLLPHIAAAQPKE